MPYYNEEIKSSFVQVLENIKKHSFEPIVKLTVDAWVTPEPVTFDERMSGQKINVEIGQSWGKLWDCAWFHFEGSVPDTAIGKSVVLLIDLSGEACIVDNEGNPVQGLTTVSSEFDQSLGRPEKRVVYYLEEAKDGEKVSIWADAGCNDLFGYFRDSGTLKEAHIAILNEEMRQLYYDFEVLHDLMKSLPKQKARYAAIENALKEATIILRKFTVDEAKKARQILSAELSKKCGDESLAVSAVGHAHIDLAWLWPIRETIRKGARTFSTVLKNMERYPDYVFGASQAQLYQWVKDSYPDLYERVKLRIADGRWEAQGAMWVEADTNVSGGEALVRQVLYGKRFFREEFGKDMKILWLPDVFGYTAALPQILKKSGVDYFMTIKLSWSRINVHPHHTFHWQGIDGSRVLTHMPPEGTYNSSAAPRAIVKAEEHFIDKGVSDKCLLLFGIGDGGGGPGEEHLELLKREKSLNGLVPVVQEPSIDFFRHIEKNADKYKVWNGELYLEYHQGTYTTQARNKRYNRKLEIALRELEAASVMAMLAAGKAYPVKELDEIWKEVLLYQFHDILPGSSIDRVYNESLARYEVMLQAVKQLTGEAYACVGENVDTGNVEEPVLLFNSLSWSRKEWMRYGEKWTKVSVPALGYTVADLKACNEGFKVHTGNVEVLENDVLKVIFTASGAIESIFDKEHNREVIAKGMDANVLAVYEDNGNAWDFSMQYDEIPHGAFEPNTTELLNDGPRIIRKSTYTYGQSTLVQEVVLTLGSRRIDFATTVNWKEENRMLRTSFPVDILTNEATCEIQFGNIKRPTHRNTSWDMAKYEVCAHKWVDLSQGDYGVALMNDCKYGHKVEGNVMDLNLLRSTSYPGSNADRGTHEFVYSLYPHEGDYCKGGVVKAAYELNIPLTVLGSEKINKKLPANTSFISVDLENIVVESVKKAEDKDDLIVRLYECHGAGGTAEIKLGFEVEALKLVDMLEEAADSEAFDSENLKLKFKPFEIHTLRIVRKANL